VALVGLLGLLEHLAALIQAAAAAAADGLLLAPDLAAPAL
jgi:hypothetical protein